jgi:hypothetical protein
MNRLFIAALLASVAVAPAYAGKDNGSIVDRAERAAEKYDSRIDRLENRLEDAGETERQRIENVIESITDKYEAKWGLPEEPPPPPPPPPEEPKVIYENTFSTPNTATLPIRVEDGELEIRGSDSNFPTSVTWQFDVAFDPSKTHVLSYDWHGYKGAPGSTSAGQSLEVRWGINSDVEGESFEATLVKHTEFTHEDIQTYKAEFALPDTYDELIAKNNQVWFTFTFTSDNEYAYANIDNVKVTQFPEVDYTPALTQ